MAPARTTRSTARNNPDYTHCSLSPQAKTRKKKRKSIFNLTGQESHIVGVTRCQRIMKETVAEVTDYKYDMDNQRTKMGFTDPNRVHLKEFVGMVERFLKDSISGGFNKLVLGALYPPEGSEPPTIPQLETAWTEVIPLVNDIKSEYTRLCKLRDNNWVISLPTPAKTSTKVTTRRKGRKRGENKEN